MPDHTDHTHVLLATLGGQPQIVTLTLDLLLRDGFPISEVYVVHPRASKQRLQQSLTRLSAEFVGDFYKEAGRVIHFHSHALQLDGQPIDDIISDAHADGTLDTLHNLIWSLKRQGRRIHLSVSGGRRLMALLAISVASLNFDRHDHIWHIYTPEHVTERVKDGKCMHVPADAGVKLIKGQFISLGAYIYTPPQSFRTAQLEQRSQMDAQEQARCARVIEQATQREREVLLAFARGLTQQEVAKELHISIKTVDAHKTNLLDYCRESWNIDPDERLGYHFLYKKFALYSNNDQYTSTERKTHQRNL